MRTSVAVGVRLPDDLVEELDEIAVQQAEAEFNIVAGENPMFFFWVKDPAKELTRFKRLLSQET